MTDIERKEVELKPCPFCGVEPKINSLRTGFSVFHKVSCIMAIGKVKYPQPLNEFMIKAWNKRPQENNALVPLDEKELFKVVISQIPIDHSRLSHTSIDFLERKREEHAKLICSLICSKFGKDNNEFGHSGDKTVSSYPEDNSGMVNPQEDIIPSCLCKVPEVNHCDERKINGSKCVKCGGIIRFPKPIICQQPPKEEIHGRCIEHGLFYCPHCETMTLQPKCECGNRYAGEPKEQYPCNDCGKLRTKAEGGTTFTVCDECWEKKYPKERKVSLEEIAKAIHHVKCHQLCPNERELIKRIGVSGVTYCKAQAILSLLNATEERKGE